MASGGDIKDSILDTVGDTPLVRLSRIAAGLTPQVVAKVEYFNPGGSIKDRVAMKMVEAAEADGRLKPGGTIVEPTSGNTGTGLAIAARIKGYRVIAVMPDKMSKEKIDLLRAYGAEVVVTPTDVDPDSPQAYYRVADRLTQEIPGAFQPNQYANPANPQTHYETTGPELWRQTGGALTHLVVGVGTGGTITGMGRYLKEQNPAIEVIGADPVGSIYSNEEVHPYLVEGVGEDFWPATYDRTIVDRYVTVSDRDSFLTTRRLAETEGLLVGGSCGLAVHAALEVAAGIDDPDAMVAVVLPDGGRGYLSKIFNDTWMDQYGFLERTGESHVGDVLRTKTRAGDIPPFVVVQTHQKVRDAIALLHEHGVSQLPVVSGTRPGVDRRLGRRARAAQARGRQPAADGRRHRRRDGGAVPERLDAPTRCARRSSCCPARARRSRSPRAAGRSGSSRARTCWSRWSRDPLSRPASCTPGLDPDPAFGGVVPPIHQASTYVQKAPGEFVGDYDYSRSANPTRTQLEKALGELEGGRGTAFSSGMAATHALITAVATAGAHAIIPSDLYGGTYRLVDKVLSRWGLEYTMVDQSDLDAVAAAVRPETKLIWVETPTNPSLNVVDVEGIVARKGGAFVAVDNTFATPVYQRPLELGADAVVHSTTKYLGGHSDAVGGAVVVRDARAHEGMKFVQNSVGAVPGPFDCFLVHRGHAHAAPADGGAHRERARGLGVAARGAGRERRPLAGLRRHGLLPPRRRHEDRERAPRCSRWPSRSAAWSRCSRSRRR